MTNFTYSIAAMALALIAATPAFAGRAGGPDTENAIVKQGVAVDQQTLVQAWAGQARELQPVVSAASLTGLASDPAGVYHAGRLTFYLPNGGALKGNALASGDGKISIN